MLCKLLPIWFAIKFGSVTVENKIMTCRLRTTFDLKLRYPVDCNINLKKSKGPSIEP